MIRNVVLFVSCVALLAILVYGFLALTDEPDYATSRPASPEESLPPRSELSGAGEPFRFAEMVEVPGGGEMMFRRYDPRTGQPTDMLRCADWQTAPDSRNEILVTRPELTMLLPSGMIAVISADKGRLAAERVRRNEIAPKFGRLDGNATILIDLETRADRGPRDERPQDFIKIELGTVEFDLERAELRSEDALHVESQEFEISGRGLELVWNQIDNRVDRLVLAQGEQVVLRSSRGLLGDFGEPSSRPAADVKTPSPASAKSKIVRKTRKPRRRPTTYECTLTGGIVADHYRGDARIAGLRAESLLLTFDVGGGAGLPGRGPAGERPSQAAERLVVRWSGPLTLMGADPPAQRATARRRLTASGDVVLERGEARVQCGSLEYHEETRQIWLHPAADGRVELTLGDGQSASARTIYVDQARGIIKLIGDVSLRSREADAAAADGKLGVALRCRDWAELKLARRTDAAATQPAAASAAAPTDELLALGRLESATFVGEVRGDFGRQRLGAQRFELRFRADAPQTDTAAGSLEAGLEAATAWGEVELRDGGDVLRGAQVDLAFAQTAEGELFPRRMVALGGVEISRGDAEISGARVTASFEPLVAEAAAPSAAPSAAPGVAPGRTRFSLRSLEIAGNARLVDPRSETAARGDRVVAAFVGENSLSTATVYGTSSRPARLHAAPFTVRGEQIDVDRAAQTLHIDGPSRLSFRSDRGLQGQSLARAATVTVSADRTLHVDGRANQVDFDGNVLARSGDETMRARSLRLLLEDAAPEAAAAPRPDSPLQIFVREARRAVGIDENSRNDSVLDLDAEVGERVRKVPVRLVAQSALVKSEVAADGGAPPLTSASLEAPRLEVDIPGRRITTTGATTLLLTNRRGVEESSGERDALGLPSALLTSGPSQTAMACDDGMTYLFGEAGPERRDVALFTGQVYFVHRAGREMVNLEDMLPAAQRDPAALARLKSRNASLNSDRMEVEFSVEGEPGSRGAGALGTAPLRLAWLQATGNVLLQDRQETGGRQVNAHVVEFNRLRGLVRVGGTSTVWARIYTENRQTGATDLHTAEQYIIDMTNGTVRVPGPAEGTLGRQ